MRLRNVLLIGAFVVLLVSMIPMVSSAGKKESGIPPDVTNCDTPVANTDDQHYFGTSSGDPKEICYNVVGDFWYFWRDRGGLAIFGYPITRAFEETMPNGTKRWVQYFERARFELYPENAGTEYVVQLGHFGHEILTNRMGSGGSTPPPNPSPSCDPQIVPHQPQPNVWWEVEGGTNVFRVVQFWTNWDNQDQGLLKLKMNPGENQDLGGGGSVAIFPAECGDAAQQWLANSPGTPTTLADLANRGLVRN